MRAILRGIHDHTALIRQRVDMSVTRYMRFIIQIATLARCRSLRVISDRDVGQALYISAVCIHARRRPSTSCPRCFLICSTAHWGSIYCHTLGFATSRGHKDFVLLCPCPATDERPGIRHFYERQEVSSQRARVVTAMYIWLLRRAKSLTIPQMLSPRRSSSRCRCRSTT